jgi:hypothetical protein
MGSGQLLDDERHALRLGVHGRRRPRLDRAAEDVLEQLGGLGRREAPGAQTLDQAHPLHVGHEVDRLGHGRELVGPDREEQEDRPIGVAPDDVAQQPQRVVVGPLDVVDEDRQRAVGRQDPDRHPGEVERPQQLGIG